MENNQSSHRSFGKWLRDEYKITIILLRSIPASVVALFVISVIAMNILANKTLIQEEWIAIDGGILISWLSFLSMDVVVKHFGPKASNRMSVFAILVNLLICLIFFIVSIIPSTADDYTAFNTIIGGTWFILLSSTVGFLTSAIVNNTLNFTIGKMFKNNPDGKLAFFTRSYISTFIAQFLDNLIFAILTFMVFAPIFWDGFHWTFVQCLTCSILGGLLELLMEVVFSPIGYLVTKNWRKNRVGQQYFDYLQSLKEDKE